MVPPRGSQSGGIGPRSDFEKNENFDFLQFFHLGPLDSYKPPFNPINRPWDPARSIELEKSFMIVLSRAS